MELLIVVYGDDEDLKSVTEAESLLTKYPNLRGILAPSAVGMANKTIQAKPGNSFPVQGMGTRAFGENNVVITGPPLIFTKDNVDQFQF